MVLSEKGWLRALKGHQEDTSRLDFKQGDKLKRAFHAFTTDKVVVFATNGKFFTLEASTLPGGRGHGEPVRLMVDLEQNHDIMTAFVHDPDRKLVVASLAGYGFMVNEADVIASTRKGKQVLNVSEPDEARCVVPVDGDMIATVGENRRMLIFRADELNEMTRGKGIRLQRFKDGGLSDVTTFDSAAGLSWLDPAGRQRAHSLDELAEWVGQRAQAGRTVPKGFPRSLKFGWSL